MPRRPDRKQKPDRTADGTRTAPNRSGSEPAAGPFSAHPRGAVLAVVVTPRSGITAIERIERDVVRVRVAAPPVAGAANAALLRFLADAAGVRPATVRLVAGTTARRKRVLFADLTPADLARRLTQGVKDSAPAPSS